MWVRVSRFEGGSAEQFDEGMRYIEENVLPAVRAMPGFQGVMSMAYGAQIATVSELAGAPAVAHA
jgi:hypothetical protein